MAVFPADHVIFNIGEFSQSIETAATAAYQLKGLVAIGINPTRPETSFGYVQVKEIRGDLKELYDLGLRYSTTFAEKPDIGTARRFIESNDFLWNSGIFLWRFDTFNSAFEKFLPEHSAHFKTIRKFTYKDNFSEHLENVYLQINSISLDYGIMEKADNVFVVESSFSWSDLGAWDELYRISMKDASNNVIIGDVISINAQNCMVNSNGKIIAMVGVEDLIVIDSDEATLICKRGDSDSIKEIIDFMRRKKIAKI
jgi:mannose-1-phosphate guanylyltransferase